MIKNLLFIKFLKLFVYLDIKPNDKLKIIAKIIFSENPRKSVLPGKMPYIELDIENGNPKSHQRCAIIELSKFPIIITKKSRNVTA